MEIMVHSSSCITSSNLSRPDGARLRHIIGASIRYDLHASDARYHKNCLSMFFSQRNAPGESKGAHDDEQEETP